MELLPLFFLGYNSFYFLTFWRHAFASFHFPVKHTLRWRHLETFCWILAIDGGLKPCYHFVMANAGDLKIRITSQIWNQPLARPMQLGAWLVYWLPEFLTFEILEVVFLAISGTLLRPVKFWYSEKVLHYLVVL